MKACGWIGSSKMGNRLNHYFTEPSALNPAFPVSCYDGSTGRENNKS